MVVRIVRKALESLSRRSPEPLEPLARHTLAYIEHVLEPALKVSARWNERSDAVVEEALAKAVEAVVDYDMRRRLETYADGEHEPIRYDEEAP